MSQHHERIRHTAKSPGVRKAITALLPLKCVDCPHRVEPGMPFQVAHLVGAEHGGDTTVQNCGPAHVRCPWCGKACNQVSGGKRGAAKTNARRAATRRAAAGRRAW